MELQEALNQILELKETLKEKEETISSLTNINEEQRNQITDYTGEIAKLKENNMNLFLRISQQHEESNQLNNELQESQQEKKGPQTWDSFMDEW